MSSKLFIFVFIAIVGLSELAKADETVFDRIGKALESVQAGAPMRMKFAAITRVLEKSGEVDLEDVEQFLSLESVLTDKSSCGMVGYRILEQNFITFSAYLGRPRLVDRFLEHCASRHAKLCADEYVAKYGRYSASAYAIDYFVPVRSLFDSIVASREQRVSNISNRLVSNQRNELLSTLDGLQGEQDARVARDSLEETAAHARNPDRRYLVAQYSGQSTSETTVHKEKIKLLYDEYLVNRCKKFVQEQEEIFVPARFDLLSLDKDKRQEYFKQLDNNFILGWRNFLLCNKILEAPEQFLEDIYRVVDKTPF